MHSKHPIEISLLGLAIIVSVLFGHASSQGPSRPASSVRAEADVTQTTRISVLNDGTEATGASYLPSISADGRWLAFTSELQNLSLPTGSLYPILLRDNQTRQTTQVGVGSSQPNGTEGLLTADGRYVTFESSAAPAYGRLVAYDRVTGRTIAFPDVAEFLPPSLFLRGITDDLRYGIATTGSGSGCFARIASIDLQTGRYTLFPNLYGQREPVISPTGRYVAVGCTPRGGQLPYGISLLDVATQDAVGSADPGTAVRFTADDRYLLVAESANGDPFGDGFAIYDMVARRRSFERNSCAINPAISPNGRFISYTHPLCGQLRGFAETYLYDQMTGRTRRVSVAPDGTSANGDSFESAVDNEGRVAYRSAATNLVPFDTNNVSDLFVTTGGVDAALPGEPQQLRARVTAGSPTSTVVLSWNPPIAGAGFTTYVIEAGSAAGLSDIVNLPTNSLNTSLVVPVDGVRTFFVRVRTANDAGISVSSNEVTVATGGPLVRPSAPVDLRAIVSGATVELTWQPPASGDLPSSYLIEVGSSPGASNVSTLSAHADSTSVRTLAPMGVHYARVRAVNAAGAGPPSNDIRVRVTGTIPCDQAPWINSSLFGPLWMTRRATHIVLNASAGIPANAYVLEVGSASGTTDLRYETRWDELYDEGSLRLYLYGAFPQGTYFVRARARNACGIGDPSNELAITY